MLTRRSWKKTKRNEDGGKDFASPFAVTAINFFLGQRSCQIQFESGWPTVADLSWTGRDSAIGKMENLAPSFTLESINRPAKGRCLMLISLIETDDSSHANTLRCIHECWCTVMPEQEKWRKDEMKWNETKWNGTKYKGKETTPPRKRRERRDRKEDLRCDFFFFYRWKKIFFARFLVTRTKLYSRDCILRAWKVNARDF